MPDLVALPCPAELVGPFLDRLPRSDGPFDALVLEKQASALTPLLRARGAREIVPLPEAMYGHVTTDETRMALRRLATRSHDRAWFPVNNFGGNVALLLVCLADEVTAVSATAEPGLSLGLPTADAGQGAAHRLRESDALVALQREIVRRLSAPDPRLEALDGAGRTGERPTHGLVTDFPYDAEVLFRYAAASERVSGRILEMGAGLGYGAWLLARLGSGRAVTAFDYDADAVALAAARFGDAATFAVGRAEEVPAPDGSADAVACFEILEHLHEPARLVAEARRVLRPGGVFVGSTPNHRLYPYRVHDGRAGSPAELRAAGLWPWHVAALDEASVTTLLADAGFVDVAFGYPTWAAGLDALPVVRTAGDLDAALDVVAQLTWSVADFALADAYVPIFSGFSFLFRARLPQGETR